MSVCSSHGSYGSSSSEYSVPRLSSCMQQLPPPATHESWYEQIPSPQSQCAQHRAPKPKCGGNNTKSLMALPLHSDTITNQPSQQKYAGPYENYDIPKTPVQLHTVDAKSLAMENYDTPKKIQEYLTKDMNSNPTIDIYGNYDMPAVVPAAAAAATMCGCLVGGNSGNDCGKPVAAAAHTSSGGSTAGARLNCTCNKVMSWADSWITLPYCRRGNGIEHTGMPINKVKLNGEGKMPVVQPSGELAIYATVDMTKKIKKKLLEEMKDCECQHNGDDDDDDDCMRSTTESANYIDLEPGRELPAKIICAVIKESAREAASEDPEIARNYMNLEFALSLENYENAKEVMQRAGFNVGELEDALKQHLPRRKICQKCGHASKRKRSLPTNAPHSIETVAQVTSNAAPGKANSGNGGEANGKSDREKDDYMLMGPGKNTKSLAGYLPMSPATAQSDTVPSREPEDPATPSAGDGQVQLALSQQQPPPLPTKTELMKRILGEKSASNPSLGPAVDRSRKRADKETRVPGSAMMLLHKSGGSPYMRKQLMDSSDLLPIDKRLTTQKRSASVDSTRFLEDKSLTDDCVSTETLRKSMGTIEVTAATVACLVRGRRASSPCLHQERETCQDLSFCGSSLNPPSADRTEQSNTETEDDASVSLNQSHLSHQSAYIRRSASVPCKGQNRDSSSSNDSGVSTGSIRNRAAEYADFERPLTTAMSSRRHQRHTQHHPMQTVHASLPRRSKSFDPLREIAFQFKRGDKFVEKSTSAGAEVPVCKTAATAKTNGGSVNKDGKVLNSNGQPYIDSRSTSSGTSDMSDYIETLSSYSHSSSDTPESLR